MKKRLAIISFAAILIFGVVLPTAVFADTTDLNTTFNRDVQCEGTAGRCDSNALDWQQAHDKTAPANNGWAWNSMRVFSGINRVVGRNGMSFDTSSLAGNVISAASLFVYSDPASGWADNGGCAIGVVGFTPASFSSYVVADYSNFGTTRYASDMALATFEADAGWREFPLNSTGISALSTFTNVGIGLRCATDIDNSPQTLSNYGSMIVGAGSAHPPYLHITYTAAPSTYNLAVTKLGIGNGTITSSPAGIDCGATCDYDFDVNTEVTLTAAAASGSVFDGWSSGCTGTGTCVKTMDTNYSIDATFSTTTPEATSTPPTATTTIGAYTGANFEEWLFTACVLLFFISYWGWGVLLRPLSIWT
jgi:hypothetical protein